MTDTTWAAKVLENVPDYDAGLLNDWGGGNVHWWQDYLRAEIGRANEAWRENALAAIARMGAGDDMVERLLENDREIFLPLLGEAAAHIAALTAQNREMALDVLASSGQAAEAYAAQLAAEAEAAPDLAELVEALRGLLGLLDAGSLYEPQAYRARAALAKIKEPQHG